MAYTYTWTDAEQTSLRREDAEGNVAVVPTDPANRDYAEFCNCGSTATAYVASAYVAPEPTALELLEARVAALEADHTTLMNNNGGGY